MECGPMGWARVPFDHFLEFVQETHRILLMSIRGVSGLQAMPDLMRALAVEPEARVEEAHHAPAARRSASMRR